MKPKVKIVRRTVGMIGDQWKKFVEQEVVFLEKKYHILIPRTLITILDDYARIDYWIQGDK